MTMHHELTAESKEFRMPKGGRFADQPIDVTQRRSIQIRSDHSFPPWIRSGDTRVILDDFYHAGAFWRARIPLDGVASVRGQVYNFSKPKTKPSKDGPEIVKDRDGVPKRRIPMANHLQSRFTLKQGAFVELFELGTEVNHLPQHRLQDFIYSVEAVGPLGSTFNLRDAMAGNLVSAHRFLSTQEMVFERIVVENQYVIESPLIPLREEQIREFLTRSLLRSHQAGMVEAYFLYRFRRTNNCTSNPFQILDRVMDYSFLQLIGSCLYRLPLSPRYYLRVRGLDADPSVRRLVRHEFAEFIREPATQQRKRDYVRRQISASRAARNAR